MTGFRTCDRIQRHCRPGRNSAGQRGPSRPWWDIGNQEATGSCVGWGSTDGVARYHFVKAGRLAPNAKLSPRYTWMASKETVVAFIFQAKKIGTGEIALKHWRHWEGDSSVTTRFRILLHVQP